MTSEHFFWQSDANTPRHHGLGKLLLAVHSLVWGGPNPQNPKFIAGDIRLRLIDCMIDFELASGSLKGTIPAELEQEIVGICNEFKEWSPKPFDQPRTSRMFGSGRGAKGRAIARALSERILAVYADIHRYDAIARQNILEQPSKP